MGFKLEHRAAPAVKRTETDGLARLLQTEIKVFGTFFNNKRKEDFYTELSVLLKAGIHLREALSLLAENQKKGKLRTFYTEMEASLVAGRSFSDILKTRKEFTEYEYHSIKIGEETGNMARILEELGKFFARKNEQRRGLMNALTYPIIILVTAVLVVVFMLRMVVPMFEDIFKQNKVELPAITKMIISASNFIKDYGWVVLVVLVALLVLRGTFNKKEWFRKNKDRLLMRLPLIGPFVRIVYLAQFTQAVALLTSSKVPLLNSIQLVKKMIGFYPLQKALGEVEASVLKGISLNESLKANKIFDAKMVSLVKVAEETNQTEFIFQRLNEQYSIEVQQKSKLLSTLMEPLIIVIVGIFVGVILVSMYLPMFKLSTVLG
ncbi:type II secretion system F family protein [Arenibacter sp. GZD96]|uniref:type II secretion system F family protein n=1 Tax=Aurantibrevibacter litoralis TaxID=3106030 RepID=UPI002AFF72DB|nr:type II secretion system F family protein [Arenibacter sp. GZD-96]MEA1786112.1 type II secretion system F family protein [Arenibacter sp. GZD-96]